ncbi:uncharacterized protein [Clytia hemisphaerica]|uniref:Uncharacterized protein n=1 Tax=Clytia hemisphaerica TaxID=252671 RepID=A0A7M5UNG8_9CNID
MIEKTVCSYGYIPEMMRPHNGGCSAFPEEQRCKQNAKKNARRRAAESRKAIRCSDGESDTSDGFTVNSGGSGRSGDWGPPRMRQKPKYSRKRHEHRASFTDSGISLTKTDSGDLSEFSYGERYFINRPTDPYSDSSHERQSRILKQQVVVTRTQRSQSKIESKTDGSSVYQKEITSLKRSSSCSALPSNIKQINRQDSSQSSRSAVAPQQQRISKPSANIEEKENAILEQCYRNEGLSPECAEMGCMYDCHHQHSTSRFPLPDHLNYPLNKYYQSETNLHRIQPLKKIRSSLRKLRNKTNNIHLSTPDRYDNYSLSDNYSITPTLESLDSSYLNSLNDFESSEAIMARLAKNPNSKKAWVKKIFKWNIGKSYNIKNKKSPKKDVKDNSSEVQEEPSLKKRSHSTRSIPEALINFISKTQDKYSATTTATHEFEFMVPTTLQRANSMPSIATNRTQTPKTRDTDVIFFNEDGPKSQQNQHKTPSKFFSNNNPHYEEEEEFDYYPHENNNHPVNHAPHHFKQPCYTSCQDIRMAPPPQPTPGHCHCCQHVQHGAYMPPQQYVQYMHPAPVQYGYYIPNGGHQQPHYPVAADYEEMVQPQPIAYYQTSDNSDLKPGQRNPPIVAPLDMKVSVERRAERRKICDMVFDTFV